MQCSTETVFTFRQSFGGVSITSKIRLLARGLPAFSYFQKKPAGHVPAHLPRENSLDGCDKTSIILFERIPNKINLGSTAGTGTAVVDGE